MRVQFYIFAIVLFVSCKKENAFDCFKPNGPDKTEARYLGRFDSINVSDKFEIIIRPGTEYAVEVTAGKNVIGNISTKVKNGELIIENNNKCNFVRGYKRGFKITITTPHLHRIFHNGVGPVTFDSSFAQDTLNIKAENSGDTYINGKYNVVNTSSHGNGDMYFAGTAKELNVYTRGTNYTWAQNFVVSDHIFVATYSLGDTYLNANGLKNLDYYIYSEGNIYYTGIPDAIKELSDGTAKGAAIKED